MLQRQMYGTGSKGLGRNMEAGKEDELKRFATIFIDNLPHGIWKVWLFNLFSKVGKIQSIYIPQKKSSISGNKFAFVRFGSPIFAQRAIKMVNGMWIWGKILVANIARFGGPNKLKHMKPRIHKPKGPMEVEVNGQGSSWDKGRELNLSKIWRPRNAKVLPTKTCKPQLPRRTQVWRKKEIPIDLRKQSGSCEGEKIPTVQVKEIGNEWLYKSVIAKLLPSRSVVRIQDQLRFLGHSQVLVRHMGGDMVVLTFKDQEERDNMFNEGKMAWLTEWFVESSKWENSKSSPCSRLIWLNCYGIPLHLWNHQTFSKIGSLWGEVVMLADETIKKLSFAVGKILISTTLMDSINKVVELDNNGSFIQIRVMEEQLVVNTILRVDCACTGCQVEASSLHKSSEVQSVQPRTKKDNEGEVSPKIPRIEEVAESTYTPLVAGPSLLGPHPIVTDKTLCPVSINSKQLVPFTGSDGFDQDTHGLRNVEYPAQKGKGLDVSYLDALKSNLMLPKMHISPLKVNSFIPLIPNYVPHVPKNSLSIVPHNKQAIPNPPKDFVQRSIVPAISENNSKLDVKPKRKQRSIEDILGLSKPTRSKRGGRKAKQSYVVFRSAMAAAALSVSTEGITNRNKLLLSESKAAWSISKILRSDFMGNDEEVFSRIMVTDEEVELRTTLQEKSH